MKIIQEDKIKARFEPNNLGYYFILRRNYLLYLQGEAAKKSYFLNGSAITRGGGVKGRQLRFFYHFVANKNVFLSTTYRHMDISRRQAFLMVFYNICQKIYGSFSPKIEEGKNCQNPAPVILKLRRKKVSTAFMFYNCFLIKSNILCLPS